MSAEVYSSVVARQCTVIIASDETLPELARRAGGPSSEVLTFSDLDALMALDAITERRPPLVIIERQFAATPRGQALVNRLKADPTLARTEIRLASLDGAARAGAAHRADERAADAPAAAGRTASSPSAQALDRRGTRRAPRVKMAGPVDVLVDGRAVTLLDLSVFGAGVMSSTILKPNQRVRIMLPDDVAVVRFSAQVVWAAFEIPPDTGPRYRAGLEFVDASPGSVEAFCARHKA
jgi:hypothetical protein